MTIFVRIRPLRGVALLAGLLGVSTPAMSVEIDRGQALYENHCQECHDERAHTREGRKVDSVAGLRASVTSWSLHAGLGWSQKEVDDVIRYLDRRFYKFTE